MKIAIIGSGYVGLVTGACFAEFGFDVTCVDKEESKVKKLQAGHIPIFEPGLEALIITHTKSGLLSFTTNLQKSVATADIVFIAVGTPSRRGDDEADLTYVFEAAKHVAQSIKGYTVIVTKSTVPVGTSNQVEAIMKSENPDADFDVVSNPEFLREGSAVQDFMQPNRVIIGVESVRAQALMKEIYRPLYHIETPLMLTTRKTAELIKYASNAFLATKITFINEIANLCESVGGDVQEVSKGMGLDTRIGSKFLNPGPGYGGSCFPKDIKALIQTAKKNGQSLRILEQVDNVNEERKALMVNKIVNALNGVVGKNIAILGLTFKPNTDDIRDAVSLYIIPELEKMGAHCRIYDPQIMNKAPSYFPDATYCHDAYDAMDNADGLVILTEWSVFRGLDIQRIYKLLKHKIIIDLRNIYDPSTFVDSGLTYVSIGRQTVVGKRAISSKTLSLFKKTPTLKKLHSIK